MTHRHTHVRHRIRRHLGLAVIVAALLTCRRVWRRDEHRSGPPVDSVDHGTPADTADPLTDLDRPDLDQPDHAAHHDCTVSS